MCAVFLRGHQKRRARPVYLANTPNRKPHFFGRFKRIEKKGKEKERKKRERRERKRDKEREGGNDRKRRERNQKTMRGNCDLLVAREDMKDERRKVKEGEDERSGRAQLSRGMKIDRPRELTGRN